MDLKGRNFLTLKDFTPEEIYPDLRQLINFEIEEDDF